VGHIRISCARLFPLTRLAQPKQALDWDGLRGRLRAVLFAPAEDHDNTPDDAELDAFFSRSSTRCYVRMEYFTRILFRTTADGNWGMKVVYNWLKDFVDVTATPQELASRLALSGTNIGGVAKTVRMAR